VVSESDGAAFEGFEQVLSDFEQPSLGMNMEGKGEKIGEGINSISLIT